jgi:hypothetical protein
MTGICARAGRGDVPTQSRNFGRVRLAVCKVAKFPNQHFATLKLYFLLKANLAVSVAVLSLGS